MTVFSVLFVFGAIIGSFLSVCVYRIPFSRLERESTGEELTGKIEELGINSPPRSFCPECKEQLLWWHNIPVVSWLLLRGKCHFCKTRIPVRYVILELLTGTAAVGSVMCYGLTPTAAVIFIFTAALIAISFIDYDHYIIPNVISSPGTIAGLVVASINQFYHWFGYPVVGGLWDSVLGVVVGAGFLLAVAEFYLRVRKIEGLGMGDVKLLAMTGAFFGISGSLYTIFVGSVLGAILGLAGIAFFGRKASQQVPFGPFLAGATTLYLFTGDAVIQWWAIIVNRIVSWMVGGSVG